MYDGLTGRYTFACPHRGEVRVRLSAFRALERLPGAAHPAVYQVTYACPCGEEHDSLVAHDELDWAPLGVAGEERFFNVMTGRLEPVDAELADRAASHIRAGVWPWTFFCYPEERPRPVAPSGFRLLAPSADRLGVAVRCPCCGCTSVNLVTPRHVDEPFYSDAHVTVVEHLFASDARTTLTAFREELHSSAFDLARRTLAA
jgi:hypothetical protein